MARALITGGAGFIGSHTAERLLHDGHTVTVLDNLSTGAWANLAAATGPLERIQADVRDADRLTELVRAGRFDAIVHLAGWASVTASLERPAEAHAVHVDGTLNVLEAARLTGVRRVVLASSTAVYGRTPPLPTCEESPLRPVSPYAAHKAEAELLCTAYRAAYGVETVVLRYFNVYGRRQPSDGPTSGVVTAFARRLMTGEVITLPGDGEHTRDFVQVSDVAAVNARAAVGPDPGEGAINVGTGTRTSLLALLAAIRDVLGVDAVVAHGPERPGDVRHSQADVSRLHERLGYTPRVDLPAGLRDLLLG